MQGRAVIPQDVERDSPICRFQLLASRCRRGDVFSARRASQVRDEHAHRIRSHFLMGVNGTVLAIADAGPSKPETLLDSCGVGRHLPPMIWATQYKYSLDAMLLGFAYHEYDSFEFIREDDDFLKAIAKRTKTWDRARLF